MVDRQKLFSTPPLAQTVVFFSDFGKRYLARAQNLNLRRQTMSQTISDQSALAEPAAGIAFNELQQQQTGLFLLNGEPASQSKLIARWQLDEHSKLYCQWVKA